MIRDEIVTGRLILRRPRRSDAGALALYAGDERVAKMTTSIPHPYLPEMAESFIEQAMAGRHRDRVWVLDATPSDGAELVGLASVRRDGTGIGYWVGPPFWNTGLATEAVGALADHLLGEGGLTELTAAVFFDNTASQQVLANCGFARTGETWLHSVARGIEVPALTYQRGA